MLSHFPVRVGTLWNEFNNDNVVNYHLQTKLQKGNVFTCECLFTGGGGVVPIAHDALDLMCPTLPSASGIWWPSQEKRYLLPLRTGQVGYPH